MDKTTINEWLSAHMVSRDEFAFQLLQRSFRQPSGWVELALATALAGGAFMLCRFIEKRGYLEKFIHWHPLRHIVARILWPLLMLAAAAVALVIWPLAGFPAVWLQFLALAAYWMIMIRLVLAVINQALPENNFSNRLERTASTTLWVCFLLWVSSVDDLIIRWMKSLKFSVGSSHLSLYTILTGLLWVGIVMVLMMWLSKWINTQLMRTTRLDINLRIVLGKAVKTLLMILSVLIALPLVGIDLTVLSVFGGALGVGLGFGLQKIASNYVSGFIILADRSIRPNDRITVNNFTGYVSEITARYVVLRSGSGQDALIPNETFVTSTVINESYTARSLKHSLNIQVGYQTDLPQALEILKAAAAAEPRVQENPDPSAYLVGFGDNGIDLTLGFWVSDPENGFLDLSSRILLTIWQRFREEGIEFPYPQREVRILNDNPAPAVTLQKSATAAESPSDAA